MLDLIHVAAAHNAAVIEALVLKSNKLEEEKVRMERFLRTTNFVGQFDQYCAAHPLKAPDLDKDQQSFYKTRTSSNAPRIIADLENHHSRKRFEAEAVVSSDSEYEN